MEQKEVIAHLAKMVSDFQTLRRETLKKCIDFANEHQLSFHWDSTYGSHQQEYFPKGHEEYEQFAGDYAYEDTGEGVWVHSSNC